MAEMATCRVDVAPIHAEPDEASEQVTQAVRGEPLTVEELREGWARVRTAYDYPGWIAADALEDAAPAADWLPRGHQGDAVMEARNYLGARYLWGGMTRQGIDCSGLVHMSYRALGRLVPRDADQQEEAGSAVPEPDLRPGDLITYGEGDADRATHVAFWLGEGRILHSTQRDGVDGVIEELEPDELRARRRKLFRI